MSDIRGYVYIAYDIEGEVLYVGSTGDYAKRMSEHRRGSEWWLLHSWIDVQHFGTLEEARQAEIVTIKSLRPRFNKVADVRECLTPGGTSLSGDGTHSPRVSVSLPADVKARIDTAARDAGMGTAKYLRRLIVEHAATLD